jgi:hypothetical protein
MNDTTTTNTPQSIEFIAAIRQQCIDEIARLQTFAGEDTGGERASLNAFCNEIFNKIERESASWWTRLLRSHLDNFAAQKERVEALPPRHPIHWFRDRLPDGDLDSIECRDLTTAKDVAKELLEIISPEIKNFLNAKQSKIHTALDTFTNKIIEEISQEIEATARERNLIAADLVRRYLQPPQLPIYAGERFYFSDSGVRLTPDKLPQPDNSYPNGYAVTRTRFQAILDESIDRSLKNIPSNAIKYLETKIEAQVTALLKSIDNDR